MASCLVLNGSQYVISDITPCTGYILMTQADYDKVSGLADLLVFDKDQFELITGFLILLFISGYVTGLIARKLGR
uniref:hypothetical protein n=1 Tax=Aeromonas sp. TaxID=647 RepID=UPI0019310021|nr:hypothetical protein [Aeromonas sp.]QHJ90270.1 Hypothetical protein [Aeromonas sp.]